MINYEITGKPMPVLTLKPQKGETIITEAGAMSWMSSKMELKTVGGGFGKMLGRAFTGESLMLNQYTALEDDQYLAISSSFPGDILGIDVSNVPIIAQKKAFLARENTVEMSVFFQSKIGTAFFGGEGFIMQKFEGTGMVFLEIDGSTVEKNLNPGESMIIDTGYLAAMEQTVKMEIVKVGGFKNTVFGGEGLFNTKVTGPGKVWLQSMPLSKMAVLFNTK